MSDENRFLEAIERHPEDDSLRLVYADWLEDRGDPRGEYLRLECQLTSRAAEPSAPPGSKRTPLRPLRNRLFKLRATLDNDWPFRVGYPIRLLAAPGPRERMDELERFLEFWYGPRLPSYGDPDQRLSQWALPYPLKRFYAFAGRWPAPDPATTDPDQFFYVGSGGHHLFPIDQLKPLRGGRLRFFMEYQGDFDGVTLLKENDPPVWIRGSWSGKEEGRGTKQVSASLSAFLITHCLMASLDDYGNQKRDSDAESLVRWFEGEPKHAVKIWDAGDGECPHYEGTFYLFHRYLLVHRSSSCEGLRFVATHREGIEIMKRPGSGKRRRKNSE